MTPNTKPSLKFLAIAATLSLAPLGVSSAATINMNFLNTGGASTVANPGYGLWGQGTETWNRSGFTTGTNLVDSTGAATTVGYAINLFNGGTNNTTSWGPDILTMQGRYSVTDNTTTSTATISGLTALGMYELLFYHASNHPNEVETANGVSASDFTGSTTTTGGITYVDAFGDADAVGTHFWYYSSVAADSSGNIVVSASGINYESATGFQIRSIPEPSAMFLSLFGVIALFRRRRA